jgi:hypothetical protein
MNPTNKRPTGYNEKQEESQLFKSAMDILCQRHGNECFNELDVVGADTDLGVVMLQNIALYIDLFRVIQSMSGGFNDVINTADLLQVCINPHWYRLTRTSLIVKKLHPFQATVATSGCMSYKPQPKPEPQPIDPGKNSRFRDEVFAITYCRLWEVSQMTMTELVSPHAGEGVDNILRHHPLEQPLENA